MCRAKPDGGCSRKIRNIVTPRGDGKAIRPQTGLVIYQEKPLSESEGCPYRKPTQVGEERILRRSRELPLRNSAKLPRNFGRRGAFSR